MAAGSSPGHGALLRLILPIASVGAPAILGPGTPATVSYCKQGNHVFHHSQALTTRGPGDPGAAQPQVRVL